MSPNLPLQHLWLELVAKQGMPFTRQTATGTGASAVAYSQRPPTSVRIGRPNLRQPLPILRPLQHGRARTAPSRAPISYGYVDEPWSQTAWNRLGSNTTDCCSKISPPSLRAHPAQGRKAPAEIGRKGEGRQQCNGARVHKGTSGVHKVLMVNQSSTQSQKTKKEDVRTYTTERNPLHTI